MVAPRRFLLGGLTALVLATASCSNKTDETAKLDASSPSAMATLQQIGGEPVHPKCERTAGQAEVQVGFVIDRNGQLLDAQITRSSGSRVLDDDALDIIRHARFKPPPPEQKGDRVKFAGPICFKVQQ